LAVRSEPAHIRRLRGSPVLLVPGESVRGRVLLLGLLGQECHRMVIAVVAVAVGSDAVQGVDGVRL
jgi:hypothetical protein